MVIVLYGTVMVAVKSLGGTPKSSGGCPSAEIIMMYLKIFICPRFDNYNKHSTNCTMLREYFLINNF